MGLFDTFIARVKCPWCRRLVTAEFQTKSLVSLLLTFRIGDEVIFSQMVDRDAVLNECLASHACGPVRKDEFGARRERRYLTADVRLRAGLFVGVENIRKDESDVIVPIRIRGRRSARSRAPAWCHCGRESSFHFDADHPFRKTPRPCENCGRHEATVLWAGEGGMLAISHGHVSPWCRCCTLRAQVRHLRKAAARLPRVERSLGTVRCDVYREEAGKGPAPTAARNPG